MLGIHDFWIFIAASLLLSITPGPDTFYIVGRTLQLGWRGGAIATLSICLGCFVHIAATALGISAILTASAYAFTVVKWLGALYLIYLGVQMLFSRAKSSTSSNQPTNQDRDHKQVLLRTVFWQGFFTNVLNPKVALFFLAFLPQFVDTHTPNKIMALAVLGVAFNVTGTLWNLSVAWFTARLTSIRRLDGAKVWLNRAIGGIFVILGIRLAAIPRP